MLMGARFRSPDTRADRSKETPPGGPWRGFLLRDVGSPPAGLGAGDNDGFGPYRLAIGPRVSRPPWNFDTWTTPHASSEATTAFAGSTVISSTEIVTLAGPRIV